jgi:PhnB protein
MRLVHIYVNFPGTCEEAFRFYEKVFETKIEGILRFGEASFAGPVPDAAKNKVMNIHMPITDQVHLMGADAIEGFGPPLAVGNNFSISAVAATKAEADRVFAMLGEGGKTTMPLANAPWGPYFGMCEDKFGIQWMISLDRPV